MEQLATVKRHHRLDPLTGWYVLAWDAFRAPRFPSDEALKPARVVGLDFDQQVENQVWRARATTSLLPASMPSGGLPSSKMKPHVNLSGAANDFQELRRFRMLSKRAPHLRRLSTKR